MYHPMERTSVKLSEKSTATRLVAVVRYLLAGCALLFFAGCYDSDFSTRGEYVTPPAATATLDLLRTSHTGTTVRIEGDIVVEGVVTANDAGGNFYRTLLFEDATGAAELLVGLNHTANDYPLGARISLRLRDLAVGMSRGVVQIGVMPVPGSGYATDYLPSRAMVDRHVTRHSVPVAEVMPRCLALSDLTPDLCGRLVRIDRLRHHPTAPEGEVESGWGGERCFVDPSGAVIYTYVSTYADFAVRGLPVGEGSITGILQRDKSGRYQLKPRHEKDLAF